MMAIINHPHRLFTKEKSIEVAVMMQENDPEWTYTPVHCPKGTGYSFIEIYDEDGLFIGKVP